MEGKRYHQDGDTTGDEFARPLVGLPVAILAKNDRAAHQTPSHRTDFFAAVFSTSPL